MRRGRLWRHPDFLKLWAGQAISLFGTGLGALPYAAVFALGASPIEMALLGAFAMLPEFLAGLFAGVWVDRLPRRPIMIIADAGRALALGSLVVAAVAGELTLPHLYAVAFVNGVLTIFFDLAYHAYLPSLLDPDDLHEGNAKLAASDSIAEAGSFSVGGFIVQLASSTVAIAADAVSYVASAFAIGSIRHREVSHPEFEERPGMVEEVREGLRALLGDAVLRALALSTVCRYFSYGVIGSVILVYVGRELGFEPGVMGVIFAVGGISSLAGALAAGPLTRRLGAGPTLALGLTISGLATFLLPLARDAAWGGIALLVAGQLIGDGADTVYNINSATVRQSVAPGRLLGRIDSGTRFLSMGVMLLATLLGGVLGETIGLRATLVVGAMGTLTGALVVFASPVRAMRQVRPPVLAEN